MMRSDQDIETLARILMQIINVLEADAGEGADDVDHERLRDFSQAKTELRRMMSWPR